MGKHVYDTLMSNEPNNSINVILTNNLSDEQYMSIKSPWILAHRISHSIIPFEYSRQDPTIPALDMTFKELTRELLVKGYHEKDWIDEHYDIVSDIDRIYGKIVGNQLGTMKSSLNGKIVNRYEWIHESFVQYMFKGKVLFRNPPENMDEYLSIKDMDVAKKIVLNYTKRINSLFRRLLTRSVGKIFVG